MNGENHQPLLVPYEPVEVQDFRKITHRFGGIYRIYPKENNQKIVTCNWLDLKTLGFWPMIIYAPKSPRDMALHDTFMVRVMVMVN